MIFHIKAASSPLSALVLMSQIVVYTIRLNVPFHMYIENKVTGFLYVALQVLLVLCGMYRLYNKVEVSTGYTLQRATGPRLCIP